MPDEVRAAKPTPRAATFPRSARMIRRGDFERAYKQGLRARGEILVVVARPNELPHSRVGLSVGRAIWRGAVQRNRVRRIFREAFRLSRRALPSGFDFVLIPAKPKLEPELAATRAELERLALKLAERWAAKRAQQGEAR